MQYILYNPESQITNKDQEKLPKNRKQTFTGKKIEETFRRATEEDPSPQMDRSNISHVYRWTSLQSYNTFNDSNYK